VALSSFSPRNCLGVVDLGEVFPGIEETLGTNFMFLFWTYSPPKSLAAFFDPTAGVVRIGGSQSK
jgi:hypothetical protein